jgi:hypothetical protein
MAQSRLIVVPCSNERAKQYVDEFHRHHGSSVQARFSLAVIDEQHQVRGVAMVGRPVARVLDDGLTLEVNRVATDGCENACSALYGAARRVGKAMGYRSMITYTREDESGVSLRASGWICDGPIRARSWNMPGRPRTDKTEIVKRGRWHIDLNEDPGVIAWPQLQADPQLFALEQPESVDAVDPADGIVEG